MVVPRLRPVFSKFVGGLFGVHVGPAEFLGRFAAGPPSQRGFHFPAARIGPGAVLSVSCRLRSKLSVGAD